MKNYYRLIIAILIVFYCNVNTYSQSNSSIVIGEPIELENLNLEHDYTYLGFHANQNYLAWWEAYTLKLYIYNLSDSSYKVIQLNRGRGPNEINKLTDLFISSDNVIFLLDQPNAKFIRITSDGDYLEDISFTDKLYSRMRGHGDTEILMSLLSTESIFYLRNGGSAHSIKINKDMNTEFPTFFHKVGWFSVNKNILVHQTQYYPYLYVYDLNDKTLKKKIKFDDSEVEEVESSQTGNGATMMFPPAKVDILNKNIIHVPENKYRVLMLSKGASDKRQYNINNLYEYDLIKEEFVTSHKINLNAESITSNDEFIFVYSKEDFSISKIRMGKQ